MKPFVHIIRMSKLCEVRQKISATFPEKLPSLTKSFLCVFVLQPGVRWIPELTPRHGYLTPPGVRHPPSSAGLRHKPPPGRYCGSVSLSPLVFLFRHMCFNQASPSFLLSPLSVRSSFSCKCERPSCLRSLPLVHLDCTSFALRFRGETAGYSDAVSGTSEMQLLRATRE